jgi:hypothetical protein
MVLLQTGLIAVSAPVDTLVVENGLVDNTNAVKIIGKRKNLLENDVPKLCTFKIRLLSDGDLIITREKGVTGSITHVIVTDAALNILASALMPVGGDPLFLSSTLLQRNTVYYVNCDAETMSAEHPELLTMQMGTSGTISRWFANGIVNEIALGPTLIRQTDVTGKATYQFTNYNLTTGQYLFLAQAGPSRDTGTLLVTSSNVAWFDNDQYTINVPGGVAIFVQSKQTGSFTGTVTVDVQGNGIVNGINTTNAPF